MHLFNEGVDGFNRYQVEFRKRGGGGYDDDMPELVRRHCILHHVAREIYESNKM